VLLARHGETDWNREHRWQGHADPPLNAQGYEQSRALAQALEATPPQAVYSSDLARARATAELVAARFGLEVALDARLREVDVGEWSGLTSAEVTVRYPAGMDRHKQGKTGWELGESYPAMSQRVLEALHAIAQAHRCETVVVVTHGGPMRSIWVAAGAPVLPRRRFENCEVEGFAVSSHEIRPIHS
jgi:2,3-bisphosphoglycerate-dependent phosphoglycerate mutase